MIDLRAKLKLASPDFVRQGVRRLRNSMAAPLADDVLLRPYNFVPDDSPVMRLNLIIPDMNPQSAFGGVVTGLEIFLRLIDVIGRSRPVDARVLIDDSQAVDERSVLDRCARSIGFDAGSVTVATIADPAAPLPTRRHDIFLPFNWWTAVNIRTVVTAQSRHFGSARPPLVYPIQEYEPQLYPFSSTHMLAREAYDGQGPLWGIFNSSLLADYYVSQGHGAERSYVFEPVITEGLRGHLDRVATAAKTKKIVVYGRPNVPRNCYPALVRGLMLWSERYPQYRDWQLVSAGTPHAPIELPDGRKVESIGKLSLGDYGDLLLGAAIGVSLMSSPHPSYPPIEMAHFGMRVVTNGYAAKNLSTAHANILSIKTIGVDALADGIAAQCAAFEADPQAALHAAPLASFLRDKGYDFIDTLAADLLATVG